MCGIIACRTSESAETYLLEALSTLEYRGYDSVGIAVRATDGTTVRMRSISRVEELARSLAASAHRPLTGVGIGHTRWATHGGVTEENAHPHVDCTGRFTVVHNGIIENSARLRAELERAGHVFTSEVDSEVIPHLLEHEVANGAVLPEALARTAALLEGAWAIVAMDGRTGRVVATVDHAPLVAAQSSHGAFFASDVSALANWVDSYRVLRDGDVVELTEVPTWSFTDDEPRTIPLRSTRDAAVLGEHSDYMHKEIEEQPRLAADILDRLAADAVTGRFWRDAGTGRFTRIAVIGCGTSLNAGGIIATALRRFGNVPTVSVIASESSELVIEPDTLVIAMSQSGETADIIRALDGAALRDCPLLAITNNPHSTIARLADAVVECNAGHEVGVAATKTFVAQVVTGVLLALSALVATDRLSRSRTEAIVDDLKRMPDLLAQSLAVSHEVVPELAAELSNAPGFLFLGRGAGVVYAAEGALKLKELTYRWAEHYPAGELKHGPLALVERGTPVFVIDSDEARLAGNIAEVESRGARVIGIGGAQSTIPALGRSLSAPARDGFRPCGPLESVIPMQMMARELALVLGRDVDKPRNLAKSVTVE